MSTSKEATIISGDAGDVAWVLGSSFRIMMMQGGFALLEAGSVRYSNTVNIMMKNMVDMGLGALIFFAIGYAISSSDGNTFFGYDYWLCLNVRDFHNWFYQFSFAATASTIDSGAIAERMQFTAYIALSIFVTGFVYPVVSRQIWHENGIFTNMGDIGVHDFAGSGAVHLLGATSAFVSAKMVGKRRSIFKQQINVGNNVFMETTNEVHQLYGTFILAVSWLSFNCGSIGVLSEGNNIYIAGVVVINTMIGGAAGMMAGMIVSYRKFGRITVSYTINPFLGALVSVTACCDDLYPWESFIIGFTSIVAVYAGLKTLDYFDIDDPLTAVPVHGFCGLWSMIIGVGLFSHERGLFRTGSFLSFGIQLFACISIILFAGCCTYIFLRIIQLTSKHGIRVKAFEEDVGLDFSEHGVNTVEVARGKIMEAIGYYCDTLKVKNTRNPFRNLLETMDIDIDSFSENWEIFKSMYGNQSEEQRQHSEIAMASLFDLRNDDQKQYFIRQTTAKIKELMKEQNNNNNNNNNDNYFGSSHGISKNTRTMFVHRVAKDTMEERELQNAMTVPSPSNTYGQIGDQNVADANKSQNNNNNNNNNNNDNGGARSGSNSCRNAPKPGPQVKPVRIKST